MRSMLSLQLVPTVLLTVTLALFLQQTLSWGTGTFINKEPFEEIFSEDYGVDTSFPIHHNLDERSYFGKRYNKMLSGCIEKYSKSECKGNEDARIKMNLDQPRTQVNYTELGFLKLRAPDTVWEPIIAFYNMNKDHEHPEKWPRGNTYTNHWESQTYMINLEDKSLRGGDGSVKKKIWDGMRPIIEEWTGQKLEPTSLYGIRVYKQGAVLATHVDRLPLVSSCIIQVSQDVDEPWPIEVYSHDGKAYNVTMEPRDMVLYESHTVLHGRPFPLKGRHYANIFVHFIPIRHDENNENYFKNPKSGKPINRKPLSIGNERKYHKNDKIGGHEQSNHDDAELKQHIDTHVEYEVIKPKYEKMNRQNNVVLEEEDTENVDQAQTDAHRAAAKGDVDALESLFRKSPQMINSMDSNLWQPIHEASRNGHLDALKFLVESGADLGAKTNNGATPLWWAKRSLPQGHSVISYLIDIGAPEDGDL